MRASPIDDNAAMAEKMRIYMRHDLRNAVLVQYGFQLVNQCIDPLIMDFHRYLVDHNSGR